MKYSQYIPHVFFIKKLTPIELASILFKIHFLNFLKPLASFYLHLPSFLEAFYHY